MQVAICSRTAKMSIVITTLLYSLLCLKMATSAEYLSETGSGNGTVLHLECLNTWFIPNTNGTACVCGNGLGGKVRCDHNNNNTKLLLTYCITYDNSSGETVIGACPFFPVLNVKSGYIRLPRERSQLNNFSCSAFYRQGQLCGVCEEGYAPAPLSYTHNCVDCSHNNAVDWIVYLCAQFLPITFFFFLALIFRLSVTTGPLNAFVFFSEVFASPQNLKLFKVLTEVSVGINRDAFEIFANVIFTLYGFWNLDFFRLFVSGYCLSPALSPLGAIAMEYAVAVYVLLLTVICYLFIELHGHSFRLIVWIWWPIHRCLARFRQHWDVKSSLVETFATFFLLSYIKLATTSIRLLNGTSVFNSHGDNLGLFLYHDATLRYFSGEHIVLSLIAILIIATVIVIPPLVLILYQFSFFHKCMDCCKLCTPRVQNGLKIFVEAFHGCYKDGSDGRRFRDFRYFAGLYFVLRIAIAVSDLDNIFSSHAGRQLIILLLVVVALAFALLRPYKLHRYNAIDAAHLVILAAIYFLLLNNVYFSLLSIISQTILVFVGLLSILPLLYATFLFFYWLLSKRKLLPNFTEKFKRHAAKSFEEIGEDGSVDATTLLHEDEFGLLPDRLVNPESYRSRASAKRVSTAPVTTTEVSIRSSGWRESSLSLSKERPMHAVY